MARALHALPDRTHAAPRSSLLHSLRPVQTESALSDKREFDFQPRPR